MEQVLDQPEGAEQSAHRPPQKDAEQHQQAQYVEGEVVLHPAHRRLERADGAGPQRPGAGVAVEDGDTDRLGPAGEDSSLLKARYIAVDQRGGDQLNRSLAREGPFYPIPTHSRHILTAFPKTSRCS